MLLTNIGMVVARVRLNRIDTDAYAQCFKTRVKDDHPTFQIGQSLTGIIADWSDQQVNGLTKAVGKPIADVILKGCQVCNICRYHHLHTCILHVNCVGTFHSFGTACCKESKPS